MAARSSLIGSLLGFLTLPGLLLAPWCSAAAAPGQSNGYVSVRLGRGHLNRLSLAATIEGHKGLFAVDTGAGGTFVGAAKYSFLLPGPERALPPKVPKTATVNGMTVPVGVARDFYVGGQNLGTLALRVVPQRYLNSVEMLYQKDRSYDFDGYLGEEILRHYNAIVDVGRLAIHFNTDPRRKVDDGRGLVASGWTRIHMADAGTDFAVECQLGDKRVRLLVDTGAPFTTLDKAAVDNAHLSATELPMRGGVIGTRQQNAGLVQVRQLVIGTYVATDVHLVSDPGLGTYLRSNYNDTVPVVGLLGGDILGKHNGIIDIGNHALYLKH